MKNKKYLGLSIFSLLLCGVITLSMAMSHNSFALSTNVLTNGDFEDSLNNWTIVSDPTPLDTLSTNGDKHGGAAAISYWNGSAFDLSISQKVTNLENGVYQLSLYTMGKVEANNIISAKVSTGQDYSLPLANTGWGAWGLNTIEQIEVRNGEATVTLNVKGVADAWGSFDDISLIKTGPLPDIQASIVSAEPINLHQTIIHDTPALPSQVTVTYDSNDTGLIQVDWDDIPQGQINQLGTYQVLGTIEGTEIQAVANITMNYRSLDINGDQSIDLIDIGEVSYRYGLVLGDNLWADKCDINNDNKIDTTDLQMVTN